MVCDLFHCQGPHLLQNFFCEDGTIVSRSQLWICCNGNNISEDRGVVIPSRPTVIYSAPETHTRIFKYLVAKLQILRGQVFLVTVFWSTSLITSHHIDIQIQFKQTWLISLQALQLPYKRQFKK